MLQVNEVIGRNGAARQSWNKNSPRDLLKQIIDTNPNRTEAELLSLFAQEVRESERQLDMVIEYWFTNNYRSLIRAAPTIAEKREQVKQREAKVAEVRAVVEKVIERKAEIKLLSLMMPNGKALKDCTGKEVKALAGKVAPWLSALAEKVKPAQTVGSVLSEAAVRSLYKGT